LCHELCLEGRPEDSAGTQHAEDIRREPRPINRRCFLSRRRFVLDGYHSGLALVTVQEIHKLGDPTLRYATHREEPWQAQPAQTLEDMRYGCHGSFVSRVDGFKGKHSAPPTLGGEPVTGFDEQCF
jgi:hypothetical protein